MLGVIMGNLPIPLLSKGATHTGMPNGMSYTSLGQRLNKDIDTVAPGRFWQI